MSGDPAAFRMSASEFRVMMEMMELLSNRKHVVERKVAEFAVW